MNTLRRLFWISRPISWPNTAYPFAAAMLLGGSGINWLFFIGTIFFLFPYNLLMYGLNDVFDYESDIKNPRKGGVEGMREARSFHPTIVRASFLISLPPLVYMYSASTESARLMLVIVIASVIAYSLKGLRFKEIPMLDSATSSLHFVGPALYAVSLTSTAESAAPFLLAFFLWGMASHAFGAIQDIPYDRSGGIRSIATVFGARPTIYLATGFYFIASILVAAQGWEYVVIAIMGFCYVLNTIRFARITDQTAADTNRGWKVFLWLNYLTGFVITILLLLRLV